MDENNKNKGYKRHFSNVLPVLSVSSQEIVLTEFYYKIIAFSALNIGKLDIVENGNVNVFFYKSNHKQAK